MSTLHEASDSAVNAFWRTFTKAAKQYGHKFTQRVTSHEMNGGRVEILVTPVRKRAYSPEWSGKLNVTVHAGYDRYSRQVVMQRSWRQSTGDWPFDEMVAHAAACAAHTKTNDDESVARARARQATENDRRFVDMKSVASELRARLSVSDDGRVTVAFHPMTLACAEQVLLALSGSVTVRVALTNEE